MYAELRVGLPGLRHWREAGVSSLSHRTVPNVCDVENVAVFRPKPINCRHTCPIIEFCVYVWFQVGQDVT